MANLFFPSDFDIELTEEEFRLLRDYIHEVVGLYFDDSTRPLLKMRLLGRLTALDLLSFKDYYHYLRFGPQRAQELDKMVTHLTNNETYFYREPSQLRAFSDSIMKFVKERKVREGSHTLRVLSAGCSTGEEPYTLAMLLHDGGHFFWNWELEVIGMDIDPVALEKARRAIYFHNSFRSIDQAVVERHFLPHGNGRQVKENIRRMVTFRQGNLTEAASYQDLRPIDVLFCRNVLIYFSDNSMVKAVRLFHDVLVPGGYLALGHAESLARITDLFAPIRFQGALIYQKNLGGNL
ncbi:MAG: protein-glutamate O-methyltransferase CheR [Vicinamibacteria bacterium]|jgi:chemotaxis protein methyltransferase CheR|nr:protein-glutamate O-methyltransferase CheR [Vicinamibacteria bacterium]